MTTRDQLLARIRQNKPDLVPLPEVPTFVDEHDDLPARFRSALAFVGGQLLDVPPGDSLAVSIRQLFPDARLIASALPMPGLELTPINAQTDKFILEQIEVAVLPGAFAVAENAAVWLPEAHMLHRALPFIAQHLVLVVDRDRLVPNMHIAYRHIDRQTLTYGTFIAGPSKTADIEQSLVIGAHGARSLTILLTTSPAN